MNNKDYELIADLREKIIYWNDLLFTLKKWQSIAHECMKKTETYQKTYPRRGIFFSLKKKKKEKRSTYSFSVGVQGYKYAKEFVEHALKIIGNGRKVAMFLKLTFLESKSRKALFEKYPPKKIWIFSERVQCAKNGDFEKYKQGVGTAVAYAWFIWEKGYNGETTIGWI